MANPGFDSAGSAQVAENLSHVTANEDLPHTGGEAVTLEHAEGGDHADPAIAGIVDATVVVSLAMAVLILIAILAKAPRMITGMLDRQIAGIRSRLDEAKALRAEAEALRDEYARKIAGAEADAAAMIAHADAEAHALLAKAEADATELTRRRARMAEDKIAAAERTALAEIRAKAADAAAKAAAELIAARHDAASDQRLVDRTIAGLGRPN